jgi:HEAT repeat protein
LDVAKSHPRIDDRVEAVDALGHIGFKAAGAAEELKLISIDPAPVIVRFAAARALRRMGREAELRLFAPELIAAAQDNKSSEEHRRYAREQLQWLAEKEDVPEAVPVFSSLLLSEDKASFRMAAAHSIVSLKKYGDADARRALVVAANADKDDDVKAAAEKALERLTPR